MTKSEPDSLPASGAATAQSERSKLSTRPYKGARDFYPAEQRLHNWVLGTMSSVAERFGFQPYNGPTLEPVALYAAKSGHELVNEQLYSFTDKGGREVAIRPEMTPTLARMVAAQINNLTFPIRWYSTPNLWRYENPQRGRTREHWQLNVDILGADSILAEVEILEFAYELMKEFGAPSTAWKIYVNNRRFMNQLLSETFALNEAQARDVIRVVDRRAKVSPVEFENRLAEAGLKSDQIALLQEMFSWTVDEIETRFADSHVGAQELVDLFRHLRSRGLGDQVEFNLEVVRGIDYYTGTVFEMYDMHPDNRRALFGGGRYDNLISLFQGRTVSGVGFGLGDVTITNFLEMHKLLPDLDAGIDVAVLFPVSLDEALNRGFLIAKELRSLGLTVESFLPPATKLSKQFQFAERRGAKFAVVVGEDEIRSDMITIKDMVNRTQERVLAEQVARYIREKRKQA